MTKKAMLAAVIAAISASAVRADEGGKFYLKGEAGYAWPTAFADEDYEKKKAKGSAAYGISAGYEVSTMFSAELAYYNFPRFDFSQILEGDVFATTQSIRSHAFFVSGNIKPFADLVVVPFVTFGIGFSSNHAGRFSLPEQSAFYASKTTQQFAWNIGAGAAYDVNDAISLSLSYKYLNLGKVKSSGTAYVNGIQGEISNPPQTKLRAHALQAGITYRF